MKKDITQKELKSLLHYDQDTGLFVWLERADNKQFNSRNAGKIAGNLSNKGDVVISIYGKPYYAHRLAWLYIYGYWPKKDIDHINMIRDDNRILNLREASKSEQRMNIRALSNNKVGYKGVCRTSHGTKWQANICVNGKRIYLGVYDTPEEAHKAYKKAAITYHGNFARAS